MKKNYKVMVSIIMVISLLVPSFGNVIFAAENVAVVTPYHFEDNVVDENNQVIGIKLTDTVITQKDVEGGIEKTITENIVYKLELDEEVYRNIYTDKQNISKIFIREDGSVNIDGTEYSTEEMNTPISTSILNDVSTRLVVESGGYETFTFYSNYGLPPIDYFHMYTYKDANFFLDPSTQVGNRISKWVFDGSDLATFRIYAHAVADARSNIDVGMVQLIAAGFATITPIWIIGVIGDVAAAYQVYSASSNGHQSMADAYKFLERKGGTVENH